MSVAKSGIEWTDSTWIRERPISFRGDMVRAILDGSKVQTRRVVKPQAWSYANDVLGQPVLYPRSGPEDFGDPSNPIRCPYGQPGDRLWVKETFCPVDDSDFYATNEPKKWVDYRATPRYSAEHPAGWDNAPDDAGALKWKSSRFMPKRYARIWLEITDVRVERVAAITEDDARAEGVHDPRSFAEPVPVYYGGNFSNAETHRDMFAFLWDQINGPRGFGWNANPWCWCITFRRVDS